MQIALVILPKGKRTVAVYGRCEDQPGLYVFGGAGATFLLLVSLIVSLLLWHGLHLGISSVLNRRQPITRPVTRVMSIEPTTSLEAGQTVVLRESGPILPARILGVPQQTVELREGAAGTRLLRLKDDRYLIGKGSGIGRIVSRGDIMGIVQPGLSSETASSPDHGQKPL